MKKIIILLAVLLTANALLNAQTLPAPKVKQWSTYKQHNQQVNGVVKSPQLKNTPSTGNGTIVLLTPDVNLQFTRVQKTNGNWAFAGAVTPGISYNLVIGQGVKNADGSVTVNPYFSVGAFGAFGAAQSPTGSIVSSASVGGCMGLYKYATLAGGYDLLSGKPFFAVGAKLSLFTFNGNGGTILSFR